MLQVTYTEIARVLAGLESSIAAAEAHGCLCGALCTSSTYTAERWFDEIVPEPAASATADDRQALALLFADTVQALQGDQMEFELLLPDENMPLDQRAVALSQWCQGFLYGFGTGEPVPANSLPDNVEEVLRDMTHIGRATVEEVEGDDEEESAYTEVVEYLRVGVQLAHDSLAEVRQGAGNLNSAAAAEDSDHAPDFDEDHHAAGTPPDSNYH